MADTVMTLTVAHEKTKHKISLPPESTVADLQAAIQHEVAVPVSAQKLVYKSKSLKDPTATLASYKIKNKSKLMLIGKKEDDSQDEMVRAIEAVLEECGRLDVRLSDVDKETKAIEGGHLPEDLVPAAGKKLRLASLSACEEMMRLLERLDSLSIPRDHTRTRAKRKQTVQRIEAMLKAADALTVRVGACAGAS